MPDFWNINSTNLVFVTTNLHLWTKKLPKNWSGRGSDLVAWRSPVMFKNGSVQGEHGTHENGCLDVLLLLLDQYIHWVFMNQSFGWIFVPSFCFLVCPLIGFGAKIFSKSCNQSSLQLLVLVVLQHCNTWNVLKRCLPRLIYLCMRPSRRKNMTMMMIMMMILSSRS